MGFFDILKGVGRGAGRLFNTVSNVGGKFFDVINKGRNVVKDVYKYATKAPIVGDILKTTLEKVPIPIVGKSIGEIAGVADKYLDVGNKVNDQIQLVNRKIGGRSRYKKA